MNLMEYAPMNTLAFVNEPNTPQPTKRGPSSKIE